MLVLEDPVDLVAGDDVDWLLKEYADERLGLVIFDVVYGRGMPDDNGVKDVLSLIGACKRVSAEWEAAALVIGHPGLAGDRRFRGSSMWHQLMAVEWHMAEGSLMCEKSKIADKRKLSASYRAEYPELRWLTTAEVVADVGARDRLIREDVALHPRLSDSARAKGLCGSLGVSERTARRLIAAVRESTTEETT